MTTVAIPNWNTQGVLPPVNPESPASPERSPYEVSLTDLVLHFNTSPERQAILAGFLRFREALHEIGLIHGFQWLDGSFLEDVEATENRAPRDIDVVTFFHLPDGKTQTELLAQHSNLFVPTQTKGDFSVDAYFVQLDAGQPEPLVSQSTYWYSMWSHRRSGAWKGYLKIDLAADGDDVARGNLANVSAEGGQP